MRVALALPALGLLGLLAAPACAGPILLFESLNWTFPGDVEGEPSHHSNIGHQLEPTANWDAWCWETDNRDSSVPDDHIIWGTTATDPLLWISETIVNDTTDAWYGYTLSASSLNGASFVNEAGTTGSPFSLQSFSASELVFSGGTLAPGQSLSLSYYLNIPTTGSFSVTLNHAPALVPEPGAIGLLCLGAAALLIRRR